MSKNLKRIPRFKSEKQEREFWQGADSTEYVDYSQMESARFPNLKLTSKPITIRLPESLVEKIKIEAHKIDIPYQSLIKQTLASRFAGV